MFLVDRDLLSQPILYLSRYIIAHKADYYRLLEEVTRSGAWEEWLLFMLRGIEETAHWTVRKIDAMRTLTRALTHYLRQHYPKLYSRELVDILFEQPYCRITNLVERELGTRQLASRYLHGLVEAGVLQEVRRGQEKLFLHSKLLDLLTHDSNDITPYKPL
jgi:Fic family protein